MLDDNHKIDLYIDSIKENFLKLGFLAAMATGAVPKPDDFPTDVSWEGRTLFIMDYLVQRYKFQKSTLRTAIDCCIQFCERVFSDCLRLKDDYADYSLFQLHELLPMSAQERELVSPGMSVREIRKLKKSLKVAKNDNPPLNGVYVSTIDAASIYVEENCVFDDNYFIVFGGSATSSYEVKRSLDWCANNLRNDFLVIGFLAGMDTGAVPKPDDFSTDVSWHECTLSITDYLVYRYKLQKSTIRTAIDCYKQFGDLESPGTFRLKDDYADYSLFQLVELLPMSAEEREKVSPDMSVREIRKLKKSLKAAKTDTFPRAVT